MNISWGMLIIIQLQLILLLWPNVMFFSWVWLGLLFGVLFSNLQNNSLLNLSSDIIHFQDKVIKRYRGLIDPKIKNLERHYGK
jgi:hypothetical protein